MAFCKRTHVLQDIVYYVLGGMLIRSGVTSVAEVDDVGYSIDMETEKEKGAKILKRCPVAPALIGLAPGGAAYQIIISMRTYLALLSHTKCQDNEHSLLL